MGVLAYGLGTHGEGWAGLVSQTHSLAPHMATATRPSSLSSPLGALRVQGLQPLREGG